MRLRVCSTLLLRRSKNQDNITNYIITVVMEKNWFLNTSENANIKKTIQI